MNMIRKDIKWQSSLYVKFRIPSLISMILYILNNLEIIFCHIAFIIVKIILCFFFSDIYWLNFAFWTLSHTCYFNKRWMKIVSSTYSYMYTPNMYTYMYINIKIRLDVVVVEVIKWEMRINIPLKWIFKTETFIFNTHWQFWIDRFYFPGLSCVEYLSHV